MNKRLRRFIIALPILAVFVTLLWTGSNPSASASKSQAQQAERVSATPPGQATAPQATAQQAMTVSTPRVVNWQQISQLPSAGTLRPGRAGAEIESDIDPATMQILKKRPYTAPSVPTPSRKIQEDPAAKTSGSAISPLAPNLVNSFESIDDADQIDGFLHRPPDCAMAAGPNHVMAAVNSMFVIYTKGGTNVGQASFANFYSPVCSSCSPFDPRVAYDTTAGRWLLLVVNGGPSTPGVSNYLLAASQTSDPTGNWWLYSLTGVLNYNGTDTWADFPQLGFDGIAPASGGAVYITSNQFTFGGSPSFRTAKLNILPKSSLYGGAGLNYWRAWDRLNSNGSQAFTLSPASMYGNNGGEYMVNTSNGGNFVSLWRVVPTFPPTAVNWTLQSTQSIGTYNIPPDAAQPGNCELMATNDSRISSGSVWRNNHLNAAFTESFDWGGGGGTVAAIRYIQINTSSNTTDFNLTYGADGLHYFFPAVATDSSENVVLTFARAGSSEFGSIRHTGRLVGETSLQGSALLKSGNLCITGGRWGDYFSAAVDPADGSRVWIYGAWAADVLGVSLPWDWGTWIGQVTFGTVCTYSINPTSQSFPAVGGTGSVSVTAGTGCTWTAVSNNPWIIVNSGSSGTGNGTVTYTVLANPFTSPDVGTITIAGQTFTVNQAANSLPTISAVGVTRQQGSPSSNSTIANVSDANQAANTLSVTVNGSSSATVNGVTVSGISISAGGVVTANVVASCTAATAGFTLTVIDNTSATATVTLTVTVTANSAPVLSYSNQSVASGGSLTINPTSGPSDNGTVSSIIVLSQGTYTGSISVNNSSGVISISGAAPAGTHTITIRATDNCGATTNASFTLTVTQANNPPTISAVSATQQQGSPTSNSTIANVSDANQAANTLSVTVNGSSSATVNGVTVSGISISAGGIVTANVVASCSATTAGFTLTVTDNASATASATLTVTVTANSAPVLSYSNQSVALGGALTINPASGPSDNGTVSSIIVQSQGTYTGSISVNNSTGVISISGAAPAGTHTITIRATDNCGATTNASFTLTVSGSCIAVSVPTNLTGGQGSIVTVPINVGNLTGQGVVSYDFTLTFNSSVLTPASPAFDAAGTLSNGLTVTPNTSTPGQITVSAFGINALSGSGTLLNLRFNVVGAPNSTTGLNFSLFRFNEGTPCSTTSNGFFTVQNNFSISGVISYCIANTKKVANVVLTTIGAPPLSGTSNSSGNYTISNIPGGAVTVTPAKTGDVNGISSFDASQVAQASAGLITLTSCQQVAADASNNGSVSSFDASQIAQFAAGLPVNPPNVTGTWKFVPANRLYNPLSSNLSNENYDAVLVGDVSGNWTSPTGPSGNTGTTVQIPVTLPNLSTKAGSSVTVPVKVGNFGTSRIVSYDFEIEFDPSVLQLLDSPVDVAGTLSDAFTITPNPAAGRLRVSGFGLARLEGSGTLLNLKFNVVGAPGASSALTWRGFAFNEDAQSNLTGGGVIIAPSNGLQYYPLARSVRLLDTRPGESGCFVPGAPLGDGMVLKQSAVGACSGIPANAVAVVGNATAVNFISTGPHWITFYPSNEQRPNTSNLNFRDNQVMSNWFTARLGADGAFNIYSHASTHLVIDVAGYYAPPEPKGLYYHPLPASVRLFDSRSGANACDAPGNPLANNGIRTVKAHGTCFNAAIPASAQAIVGSATAINFLSSGFNWATLYASGDPVPKSSSLNFTANEVVSNWFTAKLSGDGKFNIYSRASTHFVIDVAGYFSNEPVDENGMGLLYHPLAKPVRLLDTRSGGQACNAPGIPLEGYGIASLTARGTCLGETIPDSAKAIEGSATAVNFLSTGFNWITLYPFGTPQPNLSSLNFTANQIVLNWFTVGLSNDGKVSVYSQAPTHLILDLTGYFAR